MGKDKIGFVLNSGNVVIKTQAEVDMDEFVRRIIMLHRQQRMGKDEIEKLENDIKRSNENIQKMQSDIDEAFKFLRSVHREDLIKKIEKEVREMKELEKKYSPMGPTMKKAPDNIKVEEDDVKNEEKEEQQEDKKDEQEEAQKE